MGYDFPLDYEIINLGTYYHDPSLPVDAITWQYCVVPVGYVLPPVQSEVSFIKFTCQRKKIRLAEEALLQKISF